jgi:hypothetical protein
VATAPACGSGGISQGTGATRGRPRRRALKLTILPGPANLDDQVTPRPKHPPELGREAEEPVDVAGLTRVAIRPLEVERARGRRDNRVGAVWRQVLDEPGRVAAVRQAEAGSVHWGCRDERGGGGVRRVFLFVGTNRAHIAVCSIQQIVVEGAEKVWWSTRRGRVMTGQRLESSGDGGRPGRLREWMVPVARSFDNLR